MNRKLMSAIATMAAAVASPVIAQETPTQIVTLSDQSMNDFQLEDVRKKPPSTPLVLTIADSDTDNSDQFRVAPAARDAESMPADLLYQERDRTRLSQFRQRDVALGFGFSASLGGTARTKTGAQFGLCIDGQSGSVDTHLARLNR